MAYEFKSNEIRGFLACYFQGHSIHELEHLLLDMENENSIPSKEINLARYMLAHAALSQGFPEKAFKLLKCLTREVIPSMFMLKGEHKVPSFSMNEILTLLRHKKITAAELATPHFTINIVLAAQECYLVPESYWFYNDHHQNTEDEIQERIHDIQDEEADAEKSFAEYFERGIINVLIDFYRDNAPHTSWEQITECLTRSEAKDYMTTCRKGLPLSTLIQTAIGNAGSVTPEILRETFHRLGGIQTICVLVSMSSVLSAEKFHKLLKTVAYHALYDDSRSCDSSEHDFFAASPLTNWIWLNMISKKNTSDWPYAANEVLYPYGSALNSPNKSTSSTIVEYDRVTNILMPAYFPDAVKEMVFNFGGVDHHISKATLNNNAIDVYFWLRNASSQQIDGFISSAAELIENERVKYVLRHFDYYNSINHFTTDGNPQANSLSKLSCLVVLLEYLDAQPSNAQFRKTIQAACNTAKTIFENQKNPEYIALLMAKYADKRIEQLQQRANGATELSEIKQQYDESQNLINKTLAAKQIVDASSECYKEIDKHYESAHANFLLIQSKFEFLQAKVLQDKNTAQQEAPKQPAKITTRSWCCIPRVRRSPVVPVADAGTVEFKP